MCYVELFTPSVNLMSLVYLQFLETGAELGNNYTEVIAPQDVATYGGLCALASFDRTELKASTECFSFWIVVFLFGFMIDF